MESKLCRISPEQVCTGGQWSPLYPPHSTQGSSRAPPVSTEGAARQAEVLRTQPSLMVGGWLQPAKHSRSSGESLLAACGDDEPTAAHTSRMRRSTSINLRADAISRAHARRWPNCISCEGGRFASATQLSQPHAPHGCFVLPLSRQAWQQTNTDKSTESTPPCPTPLVASQGRWADRPSRLCSDVYSASRSGQQRLQIGRNR